MRPAIGTSTFRAFGCTATLIVSDEADLEHALAIVEREVAAVDAACSRFRADSELAQVHAAAGKDVALSPLLAELVGVALAAAAATGGAVDPTVGASVDSLGYDRDFARLTDRDEPAQVTPVPGWRDVALDRARGLLRVEEGVTLDLGATAKARTADRAARAVAATLAPGRGVLVNLGGDLALGGAAPEGGWNVAVATRSDEAPELGAQVVSLRGGGLASSSTAVRTWRRAGQLLHHIVDPATGAAAPRVFELVSVAAASCVAANAASTASIVWGERAPRLLAGAGMPARFARSDGRVETVCGWPSASGATAA